MPQESGAFALRENFIVPLGIGKWITSVTMTIFYVLLYYVWRQRYKVEGKGWLTAIVYGLAIDIALHRLFLPYLDSCFIAKYPISTDHTYAQVLGIISIPISGITSAHNTTGM